jgi:hypothetical protein
MSTNGSGSVYEMNSSLEGYMLGDSFGAISDDASFWDYIQTSFIPAIFPDNATSPDGYLLGFNKMIGKIPPNFSINKFKFSPYRTGNISYFFRSN